MASGEGENLNSLDVQMKNATPGPSLSTNDLSLVAGKSVKNLLEVLGDAKQLLEVKQEMLRRNVDNLVESQQKMVSLMDGIKKRFITYSNDDLAQTRLDKLQHMTAAFEKMEEEIEESNKEIRQNETKLILLKVDIAKAKVQLRLQENQINNSF